MLGKIMGFIPTKNPGRSKSFYTDTLGLTFVAEEPFALVFDSGGIMVRIQKLHESQIFSPAENTLMGWEVENIEKVVRTLEDKDVQFSIFPGMEQDSLGIWNAPSGARIAWFKDPDGNNLSLTEWPRG